MFQLHVLRDMGLISANEDALYIPESEGPFAPYCVPTATIWKSYMDQAKVSDGNLAETFNSDLDPLLIFVCTATRNPITK